MKRGYIKLWRKSIDSKVWEAGPELWYLWSYLLLKAQHQPRRQQVGYGRRKEVILVDTGQLFYGTVSLSKKLKINHSTLRKRIAKLSKLGMITTKLVMANKRHGDKGMVHRCGVPIGSVITICNWPVFQSRKDSAKNNTVHRGGTTNKNELLQEGKLHKSKGNSITGCKGDYQKAIDSVIDPITGEVIWEG